MCFDFTGEPKKDLSVDTIFVSGLGEVSEDQLVDYFSKIGIVKVSSKFS